MNNSTLVILRFFTRKITVKYLELFDRTTTSSDKIIKKKYGFYTFMGKNEKIKKFFVQVKSN